jgi:tRNA (guanine37-N1)-methyltransferase
LRGSRKSLSRRILPEGVAEVSCSFEIVGDIAIMRLPTASIELAQNAAPEIIDVHKNVKAVFMQVSPVVGDFRLRRLLHVAGENRTVTVHKESGCLFKVDVAKCYFSPRLSYERLRVAELVKPGEVVVNMFACVGCFSVLIAKHEETARIFSIDVNPVAIHFAQENLRLNRVYHQVYPVLGDSREIIESKLRRSADRVIMPLPEKALEYLLDAISSLKPSGGWIHYYDFEHTTKLENPVLKTKLKVVERLAKLGTKFEVPFTRVIRPTGPNWHQVVLDIHVTQVPDKF